MKIVPSRLPRTAVLEVLETSDNSVQHVRLLERGEDGAGLSFRVKWSPASLKLRAGDRILARLSRTCGMNFDYQARYLKRIGFPQENILGVFQKTAQGGLIVPVAKSKQHPWTVVDAIALHVDDGELVRARPMRSRGSHYCARILKSLGQLNGKLSLIATHQHEIPDQFPGPAIRESMSRNCVGTANREDLCDVPFVTIDPVGAGDHDDAVYACADDDPGNANGYVIWVAIADVAAYVVPKSKCDQEALKRGNSTYFLDRVIPMLPEKLSEDLCSLQEGIVRPCIAVRMRINAAGEKIAHKFIRGIMRSVASLNYQETQCALDGRPNKRTAVIRDSILTPLFDAYVTLRKSRDARQPLDLDFKEQTIEMSDDGEVQGVELDLRSDSQRMIEEFMVLANVAAAETLFDNRIPVLFRVHQGPQGSKLNELRLRAKAMGLSLPRQKTLSAKVLNQLRAALETADRSEMISLMILRSMNQAIYSPRNSGHFGLSLDAYAHFTSPIRRYADVITHRGLISAHDWGDDGLDFGTTTNLESIARHVSETERRSMSAERETNDRYLASFICKKMGENFSGYVSGIAGFGLFVCLDRFGIDGLVPGWKLDCYNFDWDDGRVVALGVGVVVKVMDADMFTGRVSLELISVEGQPIASLAKRVGKTRQHGKRRIRRRR
ncbi:MAG: VacB/RNase II family 3'-5' exoribonuclease [Aestuariivita sp.]|nr:VacB/RNase II family 3'-5' exoribonuclease [Aestuariivita sp.]